MIEECVSPVGEGVESAEAESAATSGASSDAQPNAVNAANVGAARKASFMAAFAYHGVSRVRTCFGVSRADSKFPGRIAPTDT